MEEICLIQKNSQGCTKALAGSILVTGGAGFIGSHVVDALLARGDEVVVLDRLHEYYDPKRKIANIAHHLGNPRFHFRAGDICDLRGDGDVLTDFNVRNVIHLAARAGVRASEMDAHGYGMANVLGTRFLLHTAAEHSVENFIFASSSSVYGDSTKIPFSEADELGKPLSVYAETKQKGEQKCREFHERVFGDTYHLPVTCLRFFTVYGPRGRPDMAPYKFVDKIFHEIPIEIFGDGSSTRDYTYVSDIVQGILLALDTPRPFDIFNLGNNTPVSSVEFISTVEDVVGKKAKREYKERSSQDVAHTCADISKARSLLGYSPDVSLRDGLEKFFSWYKDSVVPGEKTYFFRKVYKEHCF